MVLVVVAASTEHAQVAVALAPDPGIAEVMHVQRRRRAAALAAVAGQPQRALTPSSPMRRAQIVLAIPRAPRGARAIRAVAQARQAQDKSQRERDERDNDRVADQRVLEGVGERHAQGDAGGRDQLSGVHALTTHPPATRSVRASVTCNATGSPAYGPLPLICSRVTTTHFPAASPSPGAIATTDPTSAT